MNVDDITQLLGSEAKSLLDHKCGTIGKEKLHLPGPDFVDRIQLYSDRNINVMRNLQWIFGTGRLSKSGYVSIFPVFFIVSLSAC